MEEERAHGHSVDLADLWTEFEDRMKRDIDLLEAKAAAREEGLQPDEADWLAQMKVKVPRIGPIPMMGADIRGGECSEISVGKITAKKIEPKKNL